MTLVTETCAECGFDNRQYTHDDVMGTLRSIVPWYELLVEGVDDATLHARPAPDVWSAIEYGEHMADVLNLHAFGLQWMLDDDEPEFPAVAAPAPAPTPSTTALSTVLEKLAAGVTAMQGVAKNVRGDGRERRAGLGDGSSVDADWLLRHDVHDMVHHLHDIGRNLIALGVGPSAQRGVVAQINASGGGVPKAAIPEATVGPRGIVGDRQASRKHHGRAWQALCLFSADAIERLQAEGHPISFGAAGENFTVRGVDWESLRPGVQLRIGDAVCELSVPALPCAKNAQWFRDGDFMRMHHEAHRGETRWYASVVTGGRVRAGDAADVLP